MLTAMGVLAAGMLCHNPRLAYHCGFLLSFGAVAGMGWIYPALLGGPEQKTVRENTARKNFFKMVMAIRQSMSRGLLASLSVTLATFPVQLWYFYQIPVYGTVLNLIHGR